MNPWHEIPFVRLLIPLIFGIVISDSGIIIPMIILWPLFILFFILTIFLFFIGTKRLRFRKRLIPGLILNVFIFILGFFLMQLQNPALLSDFFGHYIHPGNTYSLRICSQPEIKKNSVKAVGEVEYYEQNGTIKNSSGKLLIYFSKDSMSEKLSFNDLIIIKASIEKAASPKNPYEFDYQYFLKHKNIIYQCFIKSGHWKKIGTSGKEKLMYFSTKIKKNILRIFDNHNITGKEYAIISGLLLGQQEIIDPDLMQAYSASGTIHILSVSGLHVGILFLILQFLFKPLEKYRKGRIIRTITMIGVIWLYALITGLSPSVCRASAMFTLFSVGDQLKREKNPYNTLAATAFILLIAEPNISMNVGFQLSFIAVIGIVATYPTISKLIYLKNKIFLAIWQLIAVSFAAQLATAPLSLYYFHQFPNYFLLANLAIVPLSNLIVYACCIFLTLSWIPYIPDFLSWLIAFMVKAMNSSVLFIEQLPASTTQNVVLLQYELWLYYLIILTAVLMVIFQNKLAIRTLPLLIIILNLTYLYKNIKQFPDYSMHVYHIQKSCAIDFFFRGTCWFVADSALLNGNQKINYHIKNNRIYHGINKIISIEYKKDFQDSIFYKKDLYAIFGGRKFLLFGKATKKKTSKSILEVDRIVVSHNFKPNKVGFRDRYKTKKIIIDGSNSVNNITKWNSLFSDIYNTRDKGAYSEEW